MDKGKKKKVNTYRRGNLKKKFKFEDDGETVKMN